MKAIYHHLLSFLFTASFCFFISNVFAEQYDPEKKYFATCSDSNYFSRLCNLIGSIHHVHSNDLGAIAVFDLGLEPIQIQQLNSMLGVKVYQIEMTNPYILTYLRKGSKEPEMVRGLYSFKPVVIKQALDLFPCVLYLDAGCLVFRPLDDLFKYIQQNSYFLVSCGHSIRFMATTYVIDQFNLHSNDRKWILNERTLGISAGFQGLTREVYNSYVLPIYNLTKDIRNFMDDGSSPEGFVFTRHDQTLFSIQAALLGFNILGWNSPAFLDIDDQKVPFYVHSGNFSPQTHILLQGSDRKDFRAFIQYKELSNNKSKHYAAPKPL
jgi:hypothetical protein